MVFPFDVLRLVNEILYAQTRKLFGPISLLNQNLYIDYYFIKTGFRLTFVYLEFKIYSLLNKVVSTYFRASYASNVSYNFDLQ